MVVTYGGRGGNKCAAQLRQVLEGLKMKPVATMPGLTLTDGRIKADTGEIDPASEFTNHIAMLNQAYEELAATL
jgi:NAD(P)H-dependent FMN reductase